ncbi:MAG TPA: putative sugar nucleotidyl transferase [Gemmatales bacterium]|nr:putative sugar nucleotidyl transferase [Gemmatales bacterium]HMP59435.1 putative sugar nucleotidyl transferase [Gemmatales bacterium]
MRVCVFDDRFAEQLEPLTLTRPAFDLYCGLTPLLDKHARRFGATDLGLLVKPALADLARRDHPFRPVNDLFWLHAAPTILVNGRWLPPSGLADLPLSPHVGMVGGQVAYAVLPPHLLTYCSPNTVDDCLETWRATLPPQPAGGNMIDYPWQLVEQNAAQIEADFPWRTCSLDHGYFHPTSLTIVGPEDSLSVHPTAQIDPEVVADTRLGPVVIDREAQVQSFSRLIGPCYIGPRTIVSGAKVRGSTIGPVCRIAGEIEASILQGHANKQHEGYLGHSYLGSWVNMGAGTQTADLRLDYHPIRVRVGDVEVETASRKVGSFIGDHTKVGLGCLLDAGSVVGAFAVLLAGPGLLPRYVPSFCMAVRGEVLTNDGLAGHMSTAAEVMRRRDWVFTPVHEGVYRSAHEATAGIRNALLRQRANLRMRRTG